MKNRVKSLCLCLIAFVSFCCLLCGCSSKEEERNESSDESNSSNADASAPEVDRIELTSENIFDYIDYSFTYELSMDEGTGSKQMWVYNVKIVTRSVFSDYEFYNVAITFFDGVHIENYRYKRVVRIDKTGYGCYNSMETYYRGSDPDVTTPINSDYVQVAEGGYVLIPRSV